MKRNLILVSAIIIATLASCTKDSELDSTIVDAMNSQTPIEFSTYASGATTTKGTAINSNSDFQGVGSFGVTALVSDADFTLTYPSDGSDYQYSDYTATPTAGEAVYYFGFSNVAYDSDNSKWVNTNSMYWPNYSKMMHFAAYSPASTDPEVSDIADSKYVFTQSTDDKGNMTYKYSFPYSVTNTIDNQEDLMYALTSVSYLSPSDQETKNGTSYITDGIDSTNEEEAVNLHFKHALTQIAFTATKDAALDIYVKSITICNLYNSGTFTATVVTDDQDDSAEGADDTVGNSTDDGDKVNANNFGTWSNDFSGDWISLANTDPSNENAYYAVSGSGGHSSMSHYAATLVEYTDTSLNGDTDANSIQIGDEGTTALTHSEKVLMLMPQQLVAWVPETSTSTVLNYVGVGTSESDLDNLLHSGALAVSTSTDSKSYLAIDCEIYHADATSYDAKIHDGYIFVPFETKDIDYNSARVDSPVSAADPTNDDEITDRWLAGYKITYCLHFGGGYIVEEGDHTTLPEPGCIPDTETYTLRTITYTTSVDTWVDVAESQDLLDYDTATSSEEAEES